MRPVFINGYSLLTSLGDEFSVARNIINRVPSRSYYEMKVDDVESLPCYLFPDSDITPLKLVEDVTRRALEVSLFDADSVMSGPLLMASSALGVWLAQDDILGSSDEQMNVEYGSNQGLVCLAQNLGAGAGFITFNTACTSSANALLYGHAMVACGELEKVLVVGFDGMNHATLAGFNSMGLLGDMAKPFDLSRTGIVLGEAVSAIVLASTPHDQYCVRLLGGASHCDTVSPTGTDEAGSSIGRVIKEAISNAGITRDQIHLIKAQAAGSAGNDLAEANGLRHVFPTLPPITSLKAYVGHTLGASGCCELSLLLSCFRHGFVPATLGYERSDNLLGIRPLTEHYDEVPDYTLLNYFGFGGSNTVLVLQCEQVGC